MPIPREGLDVRAGFQNQFTETVNVPLGAGVTELVLELDTVNV